MGDKVSEAFGLIFAGFGRFAVASPGSSLVMTIVFDLSLEAV